VKKLYDIFARAILGLLVVPVGSCDSWKSFQLAVVLASWQLFGWQLAGWKMSVWQLSGWLLP